MPGLIPPDSTFLFQGDSITDGGRDQTPYGSLGYGYVFLAANEFLGEFAEMNVTFLNRGVPGNTIADLEDRWTRDCIDLKPQ